MVDTANLTPLLIEPSENPTVEYKAWLDLQDQEHKGVLAKAIIALANEGGGHVVLGFSDDGPDLVATECPATVAQYDQDTINNIVKKFAEPHFHCTLARVTNPATRMVHPVVVVPGGHCVPVLSKSGTPKGSIMPQVCYVRKPGPASAPAFSQADWSRLLERCIRNRQAEMLDAIRGIVQGRVDSGTASSALTQQRQDEFAASSRARWIELTKELTEGDLASCPHGHYEVDFVFEAGGSVRLPALLEHMNSASRTKYSGWSPFWVPTRPEIAPQPINGAVECWLGRPETARILPDAAHSDFWRVTPELRAFLVRGYREDGIRDIAPGTLFDVPLPILLIGEIILYAGRLATALESKGVLQFRVRWSGLRNRLLTFVMDWSRDTGGHHKAAQDMVEVAAQIPLGRIEKNLPEIVHPLLQPLYESFGFFELPEWLVSQELSKMRKDR
jgi:hypothetical protein